MPTSGIKIGRIFGIPIYLHSSWFIIFALITYSLATQFANEHEQWSELQHWAVGVLTSLLFFGSVLFHELAHSVVALRYKIPVVSITLFVFGGVARIGREAASARQEFNIAVAGPVSSYVLAGGFWLLTHIFPSSEMVGALAGWLSWINFMLATFNLVPGFPLDGGRIFRAIVWGATGDFARSREFYAELLPFFGLKPVLDGPELQRSRRRSDRIGIHRRLSRGDFLKERFITFLGDDRQS